MIAPHFSIRTALLISAAIACGSTFAERKYGDEDTLACDAHCTNSYYGSGMSADRKEKVRLACIETCLEITQIISQQEDKRCCDKSDQPR